MKALTSYVIYEYILFMFLEINESLYLGQCLIDKILNFHKTLSQVFSCECHSFDKNYIHAENIFIKYPTVVNQ